MRSWSPRTGRYPAPRLLRPGTLRAFWIGVILVALVTSSIGLGRAPITSATSNAHGTTSATATVSVGAPPTTTPVGGLANEDAAPSSASSVFDQRVLSTASALAEAGVSPRDIRLPYIGRPAQMVAGVAIPGYAFPPSNVSATYGSPPAPSGLAYYGENDTAGTIEATTLDASSVAGTLTVDSLSALYLDDDTPDMWGTQLNAVLTNVTLQGVSGHEFWVQNSVDYFQHNDTLALGEDTWNFSSRTASVPGGNSTILRHSPNGSVITGTYIGEGPYIHAPTPFTLTLYLNSSVTADGEQECWFNYTVLAAGGVHAKGNYDWLVFNSTSPGFPAAVSLAPFEATGTHLDPVGLTNDFELDFGVGPYDGATLNVLGANASASLDYCPATTASCSPGEFRTVPAAEDFGSETGETSTGLSLAYNGTTEMATAGPFILRGLWGYPAAIGSAAGATPVTNAITVSGSPEPLSAMPYVFVFLNGSTFLRPHFEWAPDVPVWYLPPGTYGYQVMLADYAEQTGTLVVGSSPTRLSVTLPYYPSGGVYTPMWAFDNAQLAGISASGDGTLSNQYHFFNNPTDHCTECGNAKDGNLSSAFASWNDYLYPSFAGLRLVGTTAYVDIEHPPTFCVFGFSWGPHASPNPGPYFYLQFELVSTHHVTLANAAQIGGWPAMFELVSMAGLVDAAQNPFPQANVMVWNSSDDLVRSDTFVSAWLVPAVGSDCFGNCPAVTCSWCVSPDGLLLYGGTNNTVWGDTFLDPSAPSIAPHRYYSGLAEAEKGDLIFNNNFAVDNPTVYLPWDLYNASCPDSNTGDCVPPLPPTYLDRWNVSPQPAGNVAATVNGFALSGNILGPTCPDQGGNFWSDYGNFENPIGVLPFVNRYDYSELAAAIHSPALENQSSIQLGGDYVPLVRSSVCGVGTTSSPWLGIAVIAVGALVGVVVAAAVVLQARWKVRPAPWLAPPSGEAGVSATVGAPVVEPFVVVARPSMRERWARRPLGVGLWTGLGILAAYVVAALGALVVYRNSLTQVPVNPAWIPPFNPIGPSLTHPFGVLPGIGTDLFRAVWQATPWDLAIVGGILAFDVVLGWVLGSLAGMNEGGVLDALVTFLGDTLGAIPSFFLVVALFAGFATVAPNNVSLPVFVVLFGLVIWPTTARTTRERARIVAREPFLDSARASGGDRPYLFFRHILPNSVSPLLAQIPIDVAPIFFVLTIFPWFWDCAGPGGSKGTYYLIASLPPYSPLPAVNFPEWGNLLAVGTCEGLPISTVGPTFWWMVLFPLLAILFLGIAIALVCDGIDKRLKSRVS